MLALHTRFSPQFNYLHDAWERIPTILHQSTASASPATAIAAAPSPSISMNPFHILQLLIHFVHCLFGLPIGHFFISALHHFIIRTIRYYFQLSAGAIIFPWYVLCEALITPLIPTIPTTSIVSPWTPLGLYGTKFAGSHYRSSRSSTRARARHHASKLKNLWMLYTVAASSTITATKLHRQQYIRDRHQRRSLRQHYIHHGPWTHAEWSTTSSLERRRLWILHHHHVPSFLPGEAPFSVKDTCSLPFPACQLDSFMSNLDPATIGQVSSLFGPSDDLPNDICTSLDRLRPITHAPRSQCHPSTTTLFQSYFYTPSHLRFLTVCVQDDVPIVIDTGASTSLTPFRSDFIQFNEEESTIHAVGHSPVIKGSGIVEWTVTDMLGAKVTIRTNAVLCDSSDIRLLSPQALFAEAAGGSLQLTHDKLNLTCPALFKPTLCFPIQDGCNLPLMLMSNHSTFLQSLNYVLNAVECPDLASGIITFEPDHPTLSFDDNLHCHLIQNNDSNLSPPQQELLAWHWKFGHVFMRRIQLMLHHSRALDNNATDEELCHPVVIRSKYSATRSCAVPQCTACNLAKSTRRPSGSSHGSLDPEKFKSLSAGHVDPGDCVSVDQFVVAHKGRRLNSRGRERDADKYSGGTIFVDHSSGFIYIHNQINLKSGETLVGKHLFENMAAANGIRLLHLHADNGVFVSKAFREDLDLRQQQLTLSGVGAHHQNGVAERSIRTISSLARAMMLHASLYWPEHFNLAEWPLAMQHAVWIWNNLPTQDGLSPSEKFFRAKVRSHDHLRRAHVWGCPAYVLDPRLQDGKKIPKFDPRSRQGRFLGYSPDHASSVALILNTRTGYISPQFHVVFDDFFETVRGVDQRQHFDLHQQSDHDKFIEGASVESYFDESDITHVPPLDPSWQHDDLEAIKRRNARPPIIDLTDDSILLPIKPSKPTVRFKDEVSFKKETTPVIVIDDDTPAPAPAPAPAPEPAPVSSRTRSRTRDNHASHDDFIAIDSFTSHSFAAFRGRRKVTIQSLEDAQIQALSWNSTFCSLAHSSTSDYSQRYFCKLSLLQDPYDAVINHWDPLFLSTRSEASAADNPRWDEVMSGIHRDGFLDAMEKEIRTLIELNAWTQVPRSTASNVVGSTWAFKIKRFPDGLMRKLKARFCVRGDQQQAGIDFFETYAPVVSWTTVRLLLVFSLLLELKTKQVDYTAAFVQAPIDTDVFISLPRGWRMLNRRLDPDSHFKEDHVLKLNRSVYGLCQSPKNFFQHLKSNLEKCAFQQSTVDPCIFYSKNCICLTYVDDCLFFAPDESIINETIQAIKGTGMGLEVEDSVAGFLGVHLHYDLDNNTITLSQSGLIERVIKALDLESANNKLTPAPLDPLPFATDSEPFQDTFNYASVVGMLMYLCNNSRPDIAFAVHQCARYCHSPKKIHGEYLKRIGRYLKGTKDKGLITPAPTNLDIDCYVDADFAGLWNVEDKHDPHCVKSRTGFVIFVGSCPVIWHSKLQTEISLSTMESEYIALSAACRFLLPLHNLMEEIGQHCDLHDAFPSVVHSTIWEDNNGALALSKMELPRMTPRSKHIAVKYHWFREHVESGRFSVHKIATDNQIADLFTKGLASVKFQELRKKLMGW